MIRFLFIIGFLSMFGGCVPLESVDLFTPKHILTFSPSKSPDVKENILYVEKEPNEVTNKSQRFTLGKETIVDLWDLELGEGLYNIGIAAVDIAGAESALTKHKDSIKIKIKKGD